MKRTTLLLSAAFAVASLAWQPVALATNSQQDKMTECNKVASEKALKGDERKAFMSNCLSSKPAAAPAPMTQQEKMTYCNKVASEKALKGDERKAFMSDCLKKK
ncbi:MAG TPA: PsiF family protein [Steroidobacteraceae bacterium]|nr:PsiF family protein [Steroidobacteraceae bacterium]